MEPAVYSCFPIDLRPEAAAQSVYGRMGTILSCNEHKLHILPEKDVRNSQVRKQWVNREHVEPMTSEELKLTWKWAQMTFYRAWKQERLLDMGLLSEDLDLLDSLDIFPEAAGWRHHPATCRAGLACPSVEHASAVHGHEGISLGECWLDQSSLPGS